MPGKIRVALIRLRAFFALLFQGLFGDFSWRAPYWLRFLGIKSGQAWRYLRAHPAIAAQAGIVSVLILAGGGAATYWYLHRPHPITIQVEGTAPGLSVLKHGKWRVAPYRIVFAQSVAPLDKIGKSISQGTQITPHIEGTWQWRSDRELDFTPKTDWGVGEEYTVYLSEQGLIANKTRLSSYELHFKSAPFTAQIEETSFYQDPVDPNLKKVVATVAFSHPVNSADFEKHLSMRLRDQNSGFFGSGAKDYPFHVKYDQDRLKAYVHSAPLAIPEQDSLFTIRIDAGTHAARGGKGLSEDIKKDVIIPGIFNFLRVNSARLSVVDNARYEADQVLVIETTAGVQEKDIQAHTTAYLLPESPPQKSGEARGWDSAAQVTPDILKQATPLTLEPIPAEKEFSTLHSFKYHAAVGRYLYIEVDKGLKSFGGYILGQPFRTVQHVPEYPQELKIMQDGSILSLRGEKKVSILARDVPAVRYEVRQILPDQLQHLVNQSTGALQRPDFGYSFGPDDISKRFTEVQELPKLTPGKSQYLAYDLSKYLGAHGPDHRGIFLFKVESYDPKTKNPRGKSDSRLIMITDLGLLVKDAVDGSHDLFVQSIQDGGPVAGATVQVLGRNGQPLLTAVTDTGGHMHFGDLSAFKREKAPALYLVRLGNDLSFLPYKRDDRKLDLSRFDIGGVDNAKNGNPLSAYLFSDRGLYRPGDRINLGLIVKAGDWAQSLQGLPVDLEITDPRGLTVKQEKIRLSASAFEQASYRTQDTAPAGTYTASLYIAKDGEEKSLLGSTTVRVQEFLPDRMKITAHLSAETPQGWVSPDGLKGLVNLQNLFGTPAAGRRIRAHLELSPSYPAFSAYKGFTFFDPLRAKESFNDDLSDRRTDDQGEAEFDLGLDRFARATYLLRFTVEGFEAASGRSVRTERDMLVSPLSYLIGYRPDGDLRYIRLHSRRSVAWIAVNPRLQRMAVGNLQAVLLERQYVSVLTKQDDGTYKYESQRRDIPVNTRPFQVPAGGLSYALPTDKPGNYVLSIRDAHGLELNRVDFTVAGPGNLSRSLEKNAELQLTLNKADFTPGEEIEMQITAPYAGSGLITIERDKVYQYRWFKTDTTSTVQKIKLPADFEGNGYVSVAFVRNMNSDEIFMSPLSYGVAPFSVSRDRRTAKLSISTPDLVKPGDAFPIRYKSDRPGRIVLFAVDEGILQVAGYKAPDPLNYFFQKRALGVSTSQILDLILPEFKRLLALSSPAGDASGAIGRNLNPFKRKRDKPVVFWSGILDVDKHERQVVYRVPDYFNGTLRVMAVAVSPDAIGTFEKKAKVRGDFVISPNTPTFVAPGDEFDVSVSVANNMPGSGRNAPVQLDLATSPNLQVLGARRLNMNIGAMREGTALFHLRATTALGSGDMTFTASHGGHLARFSTALSVRPAMPYRIALSAGQIRNGQVELPVNPNYYPQYRRVRAGVSPVPLLLSAGLIRYLDKFPYGCTEQVVSQAMPAVVLRNHPEFGIGAAAANATLARTIDILRSRQTDTGAFGLWSADSGTSDFASVYAMHFLLEARDHGFQIPPELFEQGLDYLKQLANQEGGTLAQERTRAYAIYLLTRAGVVSTAQLSALQRRLDSNYPKLWRTDLTGIYLAATYRLLQQDRLAESLISGVHLGDPQTSDDDDYYNGMIRDAQLLYILTQHFPQRAARLSPAKIGVLTRDIMQGQYNTLSSAYTILGLESYARTLGKAQAGHYAIQQVFGNGQAQNLPLPNTLLPQVDLSPQAARVRISSSGDGYAFYMLSQGGFESLLPGTPVRHRLEVVREYTDAQGHPLQSVKQGDEIEVHIRLRGLQQAEMRHIAIVDLLPGGFDVIMDPPRPGPASASAKADDGAGDDGDGGTTPSVLPLGSSKSTWRPDFIDVREDRVVLYGTVGPNAREFVYRIRATNTGRYTVPPLFGESMYDRSIQARSPGSRITVVK